MADEAAAKAARDALEVSRRAAMQLVQGTGAARTNALLGRSAKALEERIRQIAPNLGEDSFTIVQLRATLRQVQQVLREVTLPMLKEAVVDTAAQAAEKAAKGTVDYLVEADRAFRGVGDAPIALRKASMLEVGVHGAKASVLRRLATGVQAVKGKQAEPGILQRYGMETVKHFEQELQVGLVAKKSWNEMSRDITKHSPFLQGKPHWWAHRIVRTECMGAANKSNHEAINGSSQAIGGHAPDSLRHVRRPDRRRLLRGPRAGQARRRALRHLGGQMEHPPARPNDREIITPHRARWPLPDYLEQMSDDEVEERWRELGNKREVPERPLMSTVPGFGGYEG